MVLLISFVSAGFFSDVFGKSTGKVTSIPCTDSDGGRDFEVKGTSTGIYSGSSEGYHVIIGEEPDPRIPKTSYNNYSIFYDYCWGNYQMVEAYCDSNDEISSETIICEDEIDESICSDGACVPRPYPTTKECSEFGYNTQSSTIYCCDSTCNNYDLTRCSNRTYSCSDSDGGVDYYNLGEISTSTTSKSGPACPVEPGMGTSGSSSGSSGGGGSHGGDNCVDTNTLREYICNEDGTLSSVEYTCPNNCEDGACVEEIIETIICNSDGDCSTSNTSRFCNGDNACISTTATIGSCQDPGTVDSVCVTGGASSSSSSSGGGGCQICPNGCFGGLCITDKCTDSDGGIDYYEKGIHNNEYFQEETCGSRDDDGELIIKSSCLGEGCILFEVVELECDGNPGYYSSEDYSCPNGCSDGACIGDDEDGEKVKICHIPPGNEDNKKTLEIAEDAVESHLVHGDYLGECEGDEDEVKDIDDIEDCDNGCVLGDKCYPIGYRKDSKFCSDEDEFVEYTEQTESCENNFECKSNVCVSGECVSEGMIKKILNWFRRVFGNE